MKSVKYFAVVGLSLGLIACQSNQTGGSSSNSHGLNNSSGNSASANSNSGTEINADGPRAPEDANYTYLCSVFTGPDHVLQAINLKRQLIGTPRMKDWYIIHSDSESDLYYGYYKTLDDRTQEKEYARAQADHAKLLSLVDFAGQHVFQQVFPEPLALADPEAPPEWDVFKNHGFWTLMICKYKDDSRRKQYAIDTVKTLREKGYDAYYHHFAGESEVYVGAFPRDSVKSQGSSVAKAADGSELLVLTQEVPGLDKNPPMGKNGKPMTVIMPKLEISDPKLNQLIVDFPYTLMNGEAIGTPQKMPDGSIKVVAYPSYLVQVPNSSDSETVDLHGAYEGNNSQSGNGQTRARQGTSGQSGMDQQPSSPDSPAASPPPQIPAGFGGMR